MNVLLNLSTLKRGGGQNVGLNFLDSLDRVDTKNINFYFVVATNTEIYRALIKKKNCALIIMPKNPLYRIAKEIIVGGNIIKKFKIDIIYTYFGIGFFPKFVPQISGSADSNLYFPEINFWSEYSGTKKYIRKLIDSYRVWGLKRMKALIFENEIMQKRCSEIYHIPNTIFIKPSINPDYESVHYNLPKNVTSKKYKGLFLCGWQRNKNFMIIPPLAAEFKKANFDFHFILTAPIDNSADHVAFLLQMERYGVADMISIVGPVKKPEIKSLFQQIDYVFLLSKLESFSNNIIEAWYFNKTLVISDELWSRAICQGAAIYVSRNDANDITNKVISAIQNESLKNDIIQQGRSLLSEYPTIDQRTQQEIEYVKYIYRNA
jgi:glycosyltransferase involved in cell wall biosynthesis